MKNTTLKIGYIMINTKIKSLYEYNNINCQEMEKNRWEEKK